jgi:colanic acid/amylovoran biosynthesis glycosyltransferase
MQGAGFMTIASLPSFPSVAYLAPEIPALSATFVYEEIHALASRGQRTTIFSVHKPSSVAVGQQDLYARTHYLYGDGKFKAAIGALRCLRVNSKSLHAAKLLFKDVTKIGFGSVSAVALCFQFLISFKLAHLLKSSHCTHLHVHFAHVPTQIAMYASSISGIPFTIVGHANDIFQRPLLLEEKASRAKQFITISEFNRQTLIAHGIPKEKLSVVRCGVSFDVKSLSRPWTRTPTLHIGSIGRLIEKKGFDVLIRAVASLKQKNYSISLSIAGEGPLKQDLLDLAKQLSIADSVELLGAIPHSEVAAWMESLDAFVLACKKDRNGDMDGIPVVLMEAMARGIPVISTAISGIPELVIHGHTGLLAIPNNSQDLTEKIEMLLNSALLANSLIENASRHVAHEFGMETNVNRLMAHIEAT